MTVKKLLGSQLNVLLSGVAEQGFRHLGEIGNDLIQTNILLEQAIATLNASFLALHNASQAQQEIAQLLSAEIGFSAHSRERLAELSVEISGNVNNAVTGLQFQDLTKQLMERSLNRIEGMRHLLGILGEVGRTMRHHNACEGLAEIVDVANKNLARQSKELNGQLAKTVRQQHMEVGSIELF